MGEKEKARAAMKKAGVPILPGPKACWGARAKRWSGRGPLVSQ